VFRPQPEGNIAAQAATMRTTTKSGRKQRGLSPFLKGTVPFVSGRSKGRIGRFAVRVFVSLTSKPPRRRQVSTLGKKLKNPADRFLDIFSYACVPSAI